MEGHQLRRPHPSDGRVNEGEGAEIERED